ncbi:MAG: Transcriptional regulator, AraC family [Chlorobi bacterium]|nr:Transcriptional regulator, AraC family [Chlorobiota bacterium]
MSTASIPSYDLHQGDNLSLPFRFLVLETTDGGYDASKPHRHNYHEIFYFARGGGWHDIDFREYPIEDDSLHFVNPGQVHLVRRGSGSHGFILLFTPEFHTLGHIRPELPLLTHGSHSPILRPGPGDAARVLETIGLLRGEFESDRPHREEMLRACFGIFLVQAQRLFEAGNGVADDGRPAHELIVKLMRLIDRHFVTLHAPAAYAELLCVSRNHLNSTVRKLLGTTIGELIQERIILETKRLLYHTDASVKEIAFQLNFDDPSYFSRFFRKHTGMTPQEFRESMMGKHL